jgi:hypothetical protein
MSKQLLKALRKKYRTPQDAVRALGLDAALLDDKEVSMPDPKPVPKPDTKLAPAAMVAKGALLTYLTPRLAQDAAPLDYNSIVRGVTSKNFNSRKTDIIKTVKYATKGKLAKDADIQDLANLLDALSPSAGQADVEGGMMPQGGGGPPPMQTEPNAGPPMGASPEEDGEPEDVVAKIKAYLEQEGVSPEILQNLDAFLAEQGNPDPDLSGGGSAPPPDNGGGGGGGGGGEEQQSKDPNGNGGDQGMASNIPPPTAIGGMDENELEDCVSDEEEETEEERKKREEAMDEVVPSEQSEPVTKTAMDAAIKRAVARTVQTQKNIRAAERFVRPWVGDLAMDAARPSDVYRTALKALGMDSAKVDKMHPDALLPVLEAQPRPSVRRPNQGGPRMAADAKIEGGSFAERFDFTKNITIQ